MTPKRMVVHCKVDPYDVYIGRPGVWGNPYTHHRGDTLAKFVVDTPEEAVAKYREFVVSTPGMEYEIKRQLRGKVLGCWCKTSTNPDAPCHGDVLAEIANDSKDITVGVTSRFKACIRKEDNGYAAFHYSPYTNVASGYGRTETEAVDELIHSMYDQCIAYDWKVDSEEE